MAYKIKTIVFTTILLLVFTSFITYSFSIGYKLASKYVPLIDAVMAIKLESTTAHLWLEEVMDGGTKDIALVKLSLTNAKWYANAIMHGGENSEGVLLPLNNKNLENKMDIIINLIDKYEEITFKLHGAQNTKERSEYDKRYDKHFKLLIKTTNEFELELRMLIEKKLKSYEFAYYVILFISVLISILASFVFYNYEREKNLTFAILQNANNELESTKKSLLETNKIVNKLANTDKLTQLPNRLKIDEVLLTEIKRATRYHHIFSVILLDIDFFKGVNDTFGHDVGDYALIQLSNLLKEQIRETDFVGRFGGEEFIIICTQTDINNAELLAEKLRVKIEEYEFKTIGAKTCSFGVSEFSLNDSNKDEVIKRADTALYKAKNSGRNKVLAF